MKSTKSFLVIVASIALAAPADEITGNWKTVMIDAGPNGPPQVAYEPWFELKVDENRLSGIAHMTQWPGSAPISDGKVDGDRITFTLVHSMGYSTRGGTFYPKFRCEGTVHRGEMKLTMFHSPFNGTEVESDRWEMKGTKATP
jgi:hypothetical protein